MPKQTSTMKGFARHFNANSTVMAGNSIFLKISKRGKLALKETGVCFGKGLDDEGKTQ